MVLDTNVIIRIMTGEGQIGSQARRVLDATAARYCSVMVQWELALLISKDRLKFNMPLADWMERASSYLRFVDVPVTAAIARDAGSLPGAIHGDPGDRVMIATARACVCPLITTDQKILDYAAQGYVHAIDARL